MNIKNNSGPSTVPWGTPLTTLALSDVAPYTNTCCVLLLRKASIHLYVVHHNELVSLITVGVGFYQKLSRNLILLDPVVCRYLKMMLDGVLVLEVGSHKFSWHGTHVDSQ